MKIKHLSLVLLAGVFAVSCSSDDDNPDFAEQIKGDYVGSAKMLVSGELQDTFENKTLKVTRVNEDSVVLTMENIQYKTFVVEKVVAGAKVTYTNGKYKLSGGETTTNGTMNIVAKVISGEIEDGNTTAKIEFVPGSMPMSITLEFGGSNGAANAKEIKQLNAKSWTNWQYVNLETGKIVSQAVGGDEASFEWHIAFHYYDVKTNGGEVIAVDGTTLSDVSTLPSSGYTADKLLKAEKDGGEPGGGLMLSMPPTYATDYVNEILGTWIVQTGGSMGTATYELSKKIYVIKFKDGNYAKIKFTDYSDDKDVKPVVSFYYEYPVK